MWDSRGDILLCIIIIIIERRIIICVNAYVIFYTYCVQVNGSDNYITIPGIHPTEETEYYRYQVSINKLPDYSIMMRVR